LLRFSLTSFSAWCLISPVERVTIVGYTTHAVPEESAMLSRRASPRSCLWQVVVAGTLLAVLTAILLGGWMVVGSAWRTRGDRIQALIDVDRQRGGNVLTPPTRMSRDEFDDYLEAQIGLLRNQLVLVTALRKVEKLAIVQAQQDPVRWLDEHLQVHRVKATGTLSVSVTDGSAAEQEALANAVAEAYLHEAEQRESRRRAGHLEKLKKHFVEWDTQLREKREGLKAITRRIGAEPVLAQKEQLNRKYADAVERELIEVRLKRLRAEVDVRVAEDRLRAAGNDKELEQRLRVAKDRQKELRIVSECLENEIGRFQRDQKHFNHDTVDVNWLQDEIKQLAELHLQISRRITLLQLEMDASFHIHMEPAGLPPAN
jgi:hypothetical protein